MNFGKRLHEQTPLNTMSKVVTTAEELLPKKKTIRDTTANTELPLSNMKNTPRKKWFKRKLYGYGWYPISWQGWLCLFVFLGFNYWNFMRANLQHSWSDFLLHFVPFFTLSLALLIFICIAKGRKPRWQWGTELPD